MKTKILSLFSFLCLASCSPSNSVFNGSQEAKPLLNVQQITAATSKGDALENLKSKSPITNSGGYGGSPTVNNNGGGPINSESAAPVIAVYDGVLKVSDGQSINFGSVPNGTTVQKTLRIKNEGDADLNLSSYQTLPTGFSIITPPAVNTLAPTQETTMVIQAQGAAVAPQVGTLKVTSNDPVKPLVGAPLLTLVPGAQITILDWNDNVIPHNPAANTNYKWLGSYTTTQGGGRVFRALNTGTDPVTVYSFKNISASTNFFQLNYPFLPFTIPSGIYVELGIGVGTENSPQPALETGRVELVSSASGPAGTTAASLSISKQGASGSAVITANGTQGLTYQFQALNNFVSNWVNIGAPIAANASGVAIYTDDDAPIYPMRYYRAVQTTAASASRFNIAAAIGTAAPLVCAGDSNGSVAPGFTCAGQANGTICGTAASGKVQVCNTGNCYLLGDLNGDGDVTPDDTEAFLYEIQTAKSNLAANFSCTGNFSNTSVDSQGFAGALAALTTAEYNTRVREGCLNSTEVSATRGKALVFINGPIDWQSSLVPKAQTEVCIDNLGTYDPNTGVRTGGNSGLLNGKYGNTDVLSINNPGAGFPQIGRLAATGNNDFRVNYSGSVNVPVREAVIWSTEAQMYYDMSNYRSTLFNDAFIRELQLPAQIEQNLINLQHRPDLDMGSAPTLANPILRAVENAGPSGISLFPIGNAANVNLRTRGPGFSSLPPLSMAYDSEVTVGDFAGLVAFWALGSNQGFPSDAFFGDNTQWQTNILPALNDGLSTWVAHRYTGNTEVYKYAHYALRAWASRPCGGTGIPCEKGENIRNVMMFDEANTTKDGVFPFVIPSGVTNNDGPVSSDLSALYFGAIFYDIAYEAGLGAHKSDLLMWKTISLITNNTTYPMRSFGTTVQQAAQALWPDGRYAQDINSVLTSRGIPLNGAADFRNNVCGVSSCIPAAIGPTTTVSAFNFGSSTPDSQPNVNSYGLFSGFLNGYVESGGPQYVAYQFYKHSKYGPCDALRLTDGTFNAGTGVYNNDGSFYWEGTDRELGNLVLLAPGSTIRWVRYRQRCANEATGFYAEDVRPFGFKVIKSVKNGFSFTVSLASETASTKTYDLSIVDPSLASIGPADFLWTFTDYLGNEAAASGDNIQVTLPKNEPFTMKIDRTRSSTTDTISFRERGNDFDRLSGNAFVKNFVP